MGKKILGIGVLIALSCGYVSEVRPQVEENLIAKVGSEVITLDDFKQAYKPGEEVRPQGVNIDSLKQATLDKLIIDKLILVDAKEKGFDKQVESNVRSYKNRLTVNALYMQVVRERVKVSPWEVRKDWWRLGTEVNASHILVKDKNKALEIYKELRKGEDFDKLAREYSEDRGTAEKGGALEWFGWGRMDPEFQKVAFSLKQGQISRPVQTRWGYHIIRINNRRKVDKPNFSEQKETIKRRLESQRERELSDGYLEYLRSIANIRYNEDAIQKLIKTLPEVPEEAKEMKLMSWAGGKITIGDFLGAQRGLGMFDTPEAVKSWISNWLTYEKMLPAAAWRHRFEYSPDIKKQVKQAEARFLIQEYQNSEIKKQVSVTDEEVLKYYKEHKNNYGKEFESQKYKVRTDLEREKQTAIEAQLIQELRERIPVKTFEDNLKQI